jgi:hypothetical protein
MTLWAIHDKRLHEGAGVIMVNRSLKGVRSIAPLAPIAMTIGGLSLTG